MSERGPSSTSTVEEGKAFKAKAQRGFRELMRQIQEEEQFGTSEIRFEPADVDDEYETTTT